ncbi:MAG: beta-ketoacyl synthase chain length factor [Deltaproteobacteria bacterium]|nr:beta-ketoacyl synthase chain length factor [Deltaproteobacteria bacterium]
MKMCIKGIGVIGGFGCGSQSLEEAVINQIRPIPESQSFEPDETAPVTPKLVADTALLGQLVPPKALRRVDHYSRMAIIAAYLALQDAKEGAGMDEGLPEPMGVIVATGMGPTAGTLDSQSPDAVAADLRLSPIQFSNSVHNAAAAYISMLLKIRGPNVSINQYDMSVPLAFQTALDWLEEGRAASVLVGGVDCFSKGLCNASLGTQNRKDGDSGRWPVPVGEGSAFFVLAPSGEKEGRYPFIQDVRIGQCLQDIALPSGALFIHDGSGEEADLIGRSIRQAVFSHAYGAFPSSMALDLAMAALLLKKEGRNALLPHFDFGPDFMKTPRICCLKKGAAGDLGVIEVE